MEMDLIYALSVCLIFGVLIGSCVTRLVINKKMQTSGTLVIDNSDTEDGPYMFLELTEQIDNVYVMEKIILEVRKENYLSRK